MSQSSETKDLKHQNLSDKEAIEKLRELVEDIRICLFCTNIQKPDHTTCRPMAAQQVCEEGNVWFFSDINSDKNKQVLQDGVVQLYFSHPAKDSYLVVNGEAKVVVDRAKIEEMWSPFAKAWFQEGKDDPNLSLIKVTPTSAYYWDTDGNNMINFLKMMSSIITGKNQVSGHEGSLDV